MARLNPLLFSSSRLTVALDSTGIGFRKFACKERIATFGNFCSRNKQSSAHINP
jgi:hypothetical protein